MTIYPESEGGDDDLMQLFSIYLDDYFSVSVIDAFCGSIRMDGWF